MSILSDKQIISYGSELVEPFDRRHVQPASIDVHLGPTLEVEYGTYPIDPAKDNTAAFSRMVMDTEHGYLLMPGELVLGATHEIINLPDGIAARFEGKSSLGRLGLMTHVTAGFIDPGFRGQITVEIAKVGGASFILRPGMKIGQICFYRMYTTPEHPYGAAENGSHYQGQMGPQVSRIHERFSTIEVY